MKKERHAVLSRKMAGASLLSVTLLAVMTLAGCQSFMGYQPSDQSQNIALAGKVQPVLGEVSIACTGTYHCEIAQIDQTMVIALNSHQPVHANQVVLSTDKTPLLNKKSVKVVPLAASGMKGLTNYYARVMPAKREVHVNFYPENNVDYVERFAMIHEFSQSGIYQLKAYRQKSPQSTGSLLDTASPEPLCIDLMQDSSVLRRFCKQIDAEHQGEFVETRVVTKAPVKLKR